MTVGRLGLDAKERQKMSKGPPDRCKGHKPPIAFGRSCPNMTCSQHLPTFHLCPPNRMYPHREEEEEENSPGLLYSEPPSCRR